MTDGLRPLAPSVPSSPLAPTRPLDALAPPSSSSFRDALHAAARDAAAREAAIDRVLTRRGAPLSPEQLLALQATVQRHSREVELAAKLVDKLTGAVRQVLTSQQ